MRSSLSETITMVGPNSVRPAADQPQTDPVWLRYREDGNPQDRNRLLERYLGLVHHMARKVAGRVASNVELDDLVSAGTIGLMQALDHFDLSRGLAFSTYAMQRIRGAILDELRNRDWVPRSVRAKGRQLVAAVATLERTLGRSPEPREVAGALSLDMATYWRWRGEVDGAVLVSIDGPAGNGQQDSGSLEETLGDTSQPLPGDGLSNDETAVALREAIATLPSKEQRVLALYYYEELNLRQIASLLHVTESRISQIRTQAFKRLRSRLAPSRAAAA